VARLARAVAVDFPYHIAHRGNHREDIFATPGDRRSYLDLLAEGARRWGTDIWAYCLMTNHVHLLAVPRRPDALAGAIRWAHGRYSRARNREREWTGHLWANRFHSCPLDESHLWSAVKYIELNPVRAGLVSRAEAYPWSSAPAHARGDPDPILATDRPFPGTTPNWAEWLHEGLAEEEVTRLRHHTRTGRPLGGPAFVDQLEALLRRNLRPGKRGPRGPRSPGAGRKPPEESAE
jgi:putative transposase